MKCEMNNSEIRITCTTETSINIKL